MLTAASCSASGLHVVFLGLVLYIYIYIYIYICKGIYRQYMRADYSARAYMAIYAYMQGIYAYMEPGKHIYRPYIYVCHVYMCVFMQVACCIYANECNLMQMYAPLHIIQHRLQQPAKPPLSKKAVLTWQKKGVISPPSSLKCWNKAYSLLAHPWRYPHLSVATEAHGLTQQKTDGHSMMQNYHNMRMKL